MLKWFEFWQSTLSLLRVIKAPHQILRSTAPAPPHDHRGEFRRQRTGTYAHNWMTRDWNQFQGAINQRQSAGLWPWIEFTITWNGDQNACAYCATSAPREIGAHDRAVEEHAGLPHRCQTPGPTSEWPRVSLGMPNLAISKPQATALPLVALGILASRSCTHV